VPPLAEIQARMRDAVVLGATADIVPLLVGGREPAARLAIHHRHYEASLVEAVLRRFPGVAWLLGEPFTRATAMEFVRWFPPAAPCLAEYAEDFPDFLARRTGIEHMPYAGWFARLEHHLGQVALAISETPLDIGAFAGYGSDAIPDLLLKVQSGLRFLAAPWPVDELMRVYLAEDEPDRLLLASAPVWLQIIGARGRFRIDRLDPATFTFRSAIARNLPLGAAAELALELDPDFDPGRALTMLLADGLATCVTRPCQGEQP
jgi:Putative DNA-binding domain